MELKDESDIIKPDFEIYGSHFRSIGLAEFTDERVVICVKGKHLIIPRDLFDFHAKALKKRNITIQNLDNTIFDDLIRFFSASSQGFINNEYYHYKQNLTKPIYPPLDPDWIS